MIMMMMMMTLLVMILILMMIDFQILNFDVGKKLYKLSKLGGGGWGCNLDKI